MRKKSACRQHAVNKHHLRIAWFGVSFITYLLFPYCSARIAARLLLSRSLRFRFACLFARDASGLRMLVRSSRGHNKSFNVDRLVGLFWLTKQNLFRYLTLPAAPPAAEDKMTK